VKLSPKNSGGKITFPPVCQYDFEKDSFTLPLLEIHVGWKIIRENKIEVIFRFTDSGHG
jgi:hypothetical protein